MDKLIRSQKIWQTRQKVLGFDYCLYDAHEDEIEILLAIVQEFEILENYFLTKKPLSEVLEKSFAHREEVRKGAKNEIYIFSLYREQENNFEFIGLGGLMPLNADDNHMAQIWFLAGDMSNHSRFLAKYGKEIINFCLSKYPYLINMVATWNYSVIRWLKRLGFNFNEQSVILGEFKIPYYYFWIRKDN